MAVFNGAFPILPGKEPEAKAFAAACLGERRSDFEALQERAKTTRETWTYQETPMGALMLVWFDTPDVDAVFIDLATAEDEFSVWFRAQVLDFTGVDLAADPDGPAPEVLLEWSA